MSQQYDPNDKVQGKQSNHGDYYMPVSIRHLGEMPLYRAVAWWGLLRKTAFTRDDVSRAFQIDPRRASGILNYICHRHNEGDITFEPGKRGLPGAQFQLVLRILAVHDRQPPHKPGKTAARSRQTGNQDRMMARWLLSRPVGNCAEHLARWKASCPVETSE